MNVENPEEAMTFGELLTLIAEQQRRLSVLENAFCSLGSCLDEQTAHLLVHKLRLEAADPEHGQNIQQHFAILAECMAKRGE